jgi:hypothetical protein
LIEILLKNLTQCNHVLKAKTEKERKKEKINKGRKGVREDRREGGKIGEREGRRKEGKRIMKQLETLDLLKN